MRLKARQSRFLVGLIGGWAAGRGFWFWIGSGSVVGLGVVAGAYLTGDLLPAPTPQAQLPFAAVRPELRQHPVQRPYSLASLPYELTAAAAEPVWSSPRRAPELLRFALAPYFAGPPQALLRRAAFTTWGEAAAEAEEEAVPIGIPRRPTESRWSGSFYAFVRPGSGRASLAAGGQLGGSQVAGRVAYRLGSGLSIAGRAYAPLATKGAEAAAGLDWQVLPGSLRLSVERRVALDGFGRSAWSAYAAGGFYREPARGFVVDGYAQAGVVGAHSRDAFVDGAVRAGRRIAVGAGSVIVGAGAWGAAQPGVSRLDFGPRLGAVMPVAGHDLSLALEGRLRVAGRAAPGSGVALTLGFDL